MLFVKQNFQKIAVPLQSKINGGWKSCKTDQETLK